MHSFEERINEWRNELMMVQNVDEAECRRSSSRRVRGSLATEVE